jgi:NAD(P)-dependent dehydrogenase (short-subunit alcohol dehydrogenase family)
MSDQIAAVWGASGGIGQALVDVLASSGDYRLVHAGCRNPVAPVSNIVKPFIFDLLDEFSIATAATALASVGPVDLTIVATGMLHDASGNWPEKSFAALTADAMVASFRVNTVGPALIAKHMMQAIPMHRRSVFVALSARVGSIGDNRLGGWHSYRASKAALNMVIANLAIELKRSRPNAIAVGMHPGTVDSNLSLPFQKGVADGKLFSPATSAKYLLSVIDGLTTTATGAVWAWDGQRITP